MKLRFAKHFVGLSLACSLAASAHAQTQADKDRRELMELYFASIAADRCDFGLSELEADAIIRAANALQKKLNLKDDAADVIYEEVETAFEAKLPDACKKDGDAAKAFGEVLGRIRKK
jgi:hypothetical protein